MTLRLAVGVVLGLLLHPVLAQQPARHVERTLLLHDVATLAAPELEGRATGSAGARQARAWIEARFRDIGLLPAHHGGWVHPFQFATGGRGGRRTLDGHNVVGRLAGVDRDAGTIVVTAHYDHVGVRDGRVHPGADDNASGVAALLAAARYFATHPPRHPMVFAALDAEELDLAGAKALVASDIVARGRTVLAVNLDMVSRSDANEIFAAGTYHTPWLRPILEDVQTRASVTIRFGHDRPAALAGGEEDWTRSSDHAPFHDAGLPFVYFGVEDHPDYHRPTDTAERIDPRFFGDVADMIVEALRALDGRMM